MVNVIRNDLQRRLFLGQEEAGRQKCENQETTNHGENWHKVSDPANRFRKD